MPPAGIFRIRQAAEQRCNDSPISSVVAIVRKDVIAIDAKVWGYGC